MIEVLLGAVRSPVLQDSRPEILFALARAGIPATRLVLEAQAEVALWLPDQGWESLNLGALVAAQRAAGGEVSLGRARATATRSEPANQALRLSEAGWYPLMALLDRDGTVIEDREYLSDPDGVTLLPAAVHGLRLLAERGIPTAVVTNQSGIARGLITPLGLSTVNARLEAILSVEGIRLAGIFVCPHAPEDGCRCRKPEPGLAEAAGAALGISPSRAIIAGDRQSDLDLGRRLGTPAILVMTGSGPETLRAGGDAPDYLVDDLAELATICTHPAGLPYPPQTI